jgi:hypothetical protein
MHPNTKFTTGVLLLCIGILGILLLPLPYAVYVPDSIRSAEGWKMRFLTRNPSDGSFSGKLLDAEGEFERDGRERFLFLAEAVLVTKKANDL